MKKKTKRGPFYETLSMFASCMCDFVIIFEIIAVCIVAVSKVALS